MNYDSNNIFARILRNEIPCQRIFEDEEVLAFYDLYPKAPIHALVIPKGLYCHYQHFCDTASSDVVAHFFKRVAEITRLLKVEGEGYRLITNCGLNGEQEVPHFHVHILGGKRLGPPYKD